MFQSPIQTLTIFIQILTEILSDTHPVTSLAETKTFIRTFITRYLVQCQNNILIGDVKECTNVPLSLICLVNT